jgi:chromate transporter
MSLIFKASFGFALTLDRLDCAIAMVSCAVSIMINRDLRIPSNSSQIAYPALLVMSALVTVLDFSRHNPIGTYIKPLASQQEPTAQDRKLSNKIGISVQQGVLCFLIWLGILVGTITAVNMGLGNNNLVLFESFYRIGSLIFGGGVVMIPLDQTEFVENKGWLTDEQFFQGLGLAQSLPGPMFNFAAFLGATHSGLAGAILGTAGLFGPGTILIFAMLPAWSRTRHLAWFKAVLKGFNFCHWTDCRRMCIFVCQECQNSSRCHGLCSCWWVGVVLHCASARCDLRRRHLGYSVLPCCLECWSKGISLNGTIENCTTSSTIRKTKENLALALV